MHKVFFSSSSHFYLPTSCCIYIYIYVIVVSRYEHDIQVIIAQDRGKAEIAGDDLDIMRMNGHITNFYPMEIDY